jgi:hypothetical protein
LIRVCSTTFSLSFSLRCFSSAVLSAINGGIARYQPYRGGSDRGNRYRQADPQPGARRQLLRRSVPVDAKLLQQFGFVHAFLPRSAARGESLPQTPCRPPH